MSSAPVHEENLKGLLRQQATTKQQIRVVSLQLEDSALCVRVARETLVESEQHFAAMSSQLTYLEGTSVAPVPSHQTPPAEAAGPSTPAVDTTVTVDLSLPDDLGLRDPASPAYTRARILQAKLAASTNDSAPSRADTDTTVPDQQPVPHTETNNDGGTIDTSGVLDNSASEHDLREALARQQRDYSLMAARTACADALDLLTSATADFELAKLEHTISQEEHLFYETRLAGLQRSLDTLQSDYTEQHRPARQVASSAPATPAQDAAGTSTPVQPIRPDQTSVSRQSPIQFLFPSDTPTDQATASNTTTTMMDSSGAALQFTNGRCPHFKPPSSAPLFHGDVQHYGEDKKFFETMRNTLILANLWMAIQFHPLPPFMWTLTAACYATLASTAATHRVKQLVTKHRPEDSMVGNPQSLWNAMKSMINPLASNPTLLANMEDDYFSTKMTTTTNPFLDLQHFVDTLDAKATELDNLHIDGWEPTNSQLCTLLRRNIPPALNTAGLSLHVRFTDFEASYATLLQLASEYNANNGLQTLDGSAKALTAGAASKPEKSGRTPSKASLTKPSHGPSCNFHGHRKPDGYSGPGPWYTPGHNRSDCKAETTSKTNGDPRKSKKKAPGPKACHKCGDYGHLKRDCPANTTQAEANTDRQKAAALLAKAEATVSGVGAKAMAAAASPTPSSAQSSQRESLPKGYQWQAMPTSAALTAAALLASASGAQGSTLTTGDVFAPGPQFGFPPIDNNNYYCDGYNIDPSVGYSDESSTTAPLDYVVPAGWPYTTQTDGVAFYHGTTSNLTGNGTADSGANWGVVPHDQVLASNDFFPWFQHFPKVQIPNDVYFGNSSSGKVATWIMDGLVGQYRKVVYKDGTSGVIIVGPFLPTVGATHFLIAVRQLVRLYPGSQMIQDDTGMRLRFQDSRIVELHDTGHGLYDLPLHHLHADQPRPSIKETADPFSPTPAWRKTNTPCAFKAARLNFFPYNQY